uniref:Myb-like protein Q-like n=1 Tax=Saccoglossus kowalevskii TaxID=10224 RepID=A0ABM0M7L2_SACKO|nr:PREDICTED: myb-like protein Q-like [Saccoglossus kowalevskii]
MASYKRKSCLQKFKKVFYHDDSLPCKGKDSSYLKQEALMRSRYAIEELVKSKCRPDNVEETDYLSCSSNYETLQGQWADDGPLSLQNSGGVCPSSYHQSADRHSPVFPSTYVYHRYQPRERSTTVRTKGLNTVTLQQHQMLQQQQQQQPGLQQCQYYGYSYEQIQQYAYMQTKETLPPQYGAHQRLSHLPMEYYNNNNNSYVQWSVQSQPEIKSEPLFTDFEKYRHLDQFSLTPQTSPDSSYNVQSSVVISQNLYPVTPLSPPPSPVTMTTGMCVQMPSPKPQCTVQGLRSNQLHHVDNYPNSSRKTVTPSQLNSAYTNCSSHQYIQNKYNGVRKTPVTLLNGDRNQSCRYNNLKHFHNSQTKYCQLAEDTSSQLPLNTNPAVEVDIVSNNPISDLHRASSLPPIGSFLDFLNEELIVPINT